MKKYINNIFALCLVITMFTGCFSVRFPNANSDRETLNIENLNSNHLSASDAVFISDIAYDVNPHLGYTVFIIEGGKHIPYLGFNQRL